MTPWQLSAESYGDYGLKVFPASDALLPQPPVDWIVEGLIANGTLNVLFGDAGCKKTWTTLDMAVSVASGGENFSGNWLNFAITQKNVLYIDEESGKRRLLERLGNLQRGHGISLPIPLDIACMNHFDLRSDDILKRVKRVVAAKKVELVVIDALVDVCPGADENSVKDMRPLMVGLRSITEDTQAAVLAIHHAGKSKLYRGSSVIKDESDLFLSVVSKPGDPHITFKSEKARDSEPLSFSALAHFEADKFYLTPTEGTSDVTKLGKTKSYVLEYLLKNGASSVTSIKANTNTSEQSARNSLYDLRDDGFVIRVDSGTRTQRAIYDLTEKGAKLAKHKPPSLS